MNRLPLLLLVLLAAFPVAAAPTSLLQIPTADVLDPGALRLEYAETGPLLLAEGCERFLCLQYAPAPGWELGLDFCLHEAAGPWANLKWRAWDDGPTVLALGLLALGPDTDAQPYAVLAHSLGDTRLHLGTVLVDGHLELLAGFDAPLAERVSLLADYLSGPEGCLGAGLCLDLSGGLWLTAGGLFALTAESEDSWYLDLYWEFPGSG